MNTTLRLTILSTLFPFLLQGQFDVSIGTGSMWLDGDVNILCGLGSVNFIDIGIDYQLKNNFYFGGSIGYGNAKGLAQYQVWQHRNNGGGLVESFYDAYENTIYAPYHSTNILSSSLGLSYKLYLNHDNIFLKAGFHAGFSRASTYMNLYNAENNIYELPPLPSRATEPSYPPSLFDDTFDSKMDEAGSFFQYGPSLSMGFNVSKNGYVGVGYSLQITNTDYLDGISYRTALDKTNNDDNIHKASIDYTHRFGTFHW